MSLKLRGKVWHYHFWLNGVRYRGTTKQTVESRANKVEGLIFAQAKQQGGVSILRQSVLLKDFSKRFFEWVEAGNLETKSKLYYENGWRLIQGTSLPGTRLSVITTDGIRAIKFGGSAANGNCALRTLRRMLNKAQEWGVITLAPKVKLLREFGRETFIDLSIESKLLPFATRNLHDALIIMDDTGLRNHSEIYTMRWENVLWEQGQIFNPKGKSQKARRFIPMSDRVRKVLQSRTPKQTGWVFPSRKKACGHITTLAKQFRFAREKAGFDKSLVMYCARHGFATFAVAAVGNIAAVSKAMGHSDIKTTMRYVHPEIVEIAAALNEREVRHNSRHTEALPN